MYVENTGDRLDILQSQNVVVFQLQDNVGCHMGSHKMKVADSPLYTVTQRAQIWGICHVLTITFYGC